MNVALIFAGGRGQRMNTKTVPKQFLELHGKPIIIYTLEQFEEHSEIDAIVVVCLEPYQKYLKKLLKKFGIQKVLAIVPGGGSGQESIYHGVSKLHELFPEDTIVLVHDGVRPLIDEETISANIECVKKNGSAVTVSPAIETIALRSEQSNEMKDIVERRRCCMAKAPQSFVLRDLWNAHQKAIAEGRNDFIDSASLMRQYGYKLFTVEGSPSNIKITTPSDFYIFRALVDAREAEQIMGL